MDSQENTVHTEGRPVDPQHQQFDADRSGLNEPARRSGASWLLIAFLGLAAVLFGAAAWLFFTFASSDDSAAGTQIEGLNLSAPIEVGDAAASQDNTAFVDVDETQRVSAAARDILTTVYTYDHNSIDGHADRIEALMTPAMFAQYQQVQPPNAEIVKQAKTTVQAAIPEVGVGVVSITGDTAIVEALLRVEGDNDGTPILNAQSPMRMLLQKVDGDWIAANIQQL